MKIEEIRKKYIKNIELYDSLGKNLVDSILTLLKENTIKVLSVTYRVKDVTSFIEKIDRKSYEDPLNDIEDICGIRIICYYKKDIELINTILSEELKIYESTDKESKLKYDQFGYRSHHLIASIKNDWEKVPSFRNLSKLKTEIQIRTVLMHAWAEIEHSLAYKNEAQTPSQFRRKIHRISAKLEEADEQFEELKKESEEYQIGIVESVKNENTEIELNLDTLQAFMNNNFPSRQKDIESTGKLLDQMTEYNISLTDLNQAWKKVKPKFNEIENEYWRERPNYSKWAQVGIARLILDIYSEEFIKRHSPSNKEKRIKLKNKYFS